MTNPSTHISRRRFTKATGLGLGAVLTGSMSYPKFLSGQSKPLGKIAVQLWSVRKELEKDLHGPIERIAEMGYVGVETAFFPDDVSPEKAAKVIRQAGLEVCGVHLELPEGEKNEAAMQDMAEAYNCKRMVWHGWPEDVRYKTPEGTQELVGIYNEANAFAKENGLAFGIHNHWWEFEKQASGGYPYQILLESLDPDIFFEIDTYWAKVAGQDPANVVKQFGARAPMLHIKDGPASWKEALDDNKPDPMVAAGQGTQNFPEVVRAANGHTEWMIVELDLCATDMLTAIKESYTYLIDNKLAVGKL